MCDAATGASSKILTETDKYWINIADDLYFFSDGKRFLWSSERTGFRHYYSTISRATNSSSSPAASGELRGNGGFGPGASSHPAVDEAHGYIYFVSNKDNVIDSELYRLSLADKSITRITRDDGWHDPLIAPDASAFVDTYSNAMTPPRQDLYRMDGSRAAVINDDRVPETRRLRSFSRRVSDRQGQRRHPARRQNDQAAQFRSLAKISRSRRCLWRPAGSASGGRLGQYRFLWLEMMAEKGFIVFTLDHRGSYRHGHDFEVPIYHHLGKVELEDQLTGVRYLKSLPYVDGSRIGIWGWSYGGTMVLNALFNAPDVFKAGVAVAPVTDWRLYDTIYTERYMGRPQDNPEGYMDFSPVHQVGQLRAKLMIAHGTGDDNVHFANTTGADQRTHSRWQLSR